MSLPSGSRLGPYEIVAPLGAGFSPDGKWIAYVSDASGRLDAYVVPYPGPGGKRRVSAGGGVSPVWSRDGRELFYQTASGMMSVPLTAGADLRFGAPQLLFGGNSVSNSREDGPREYVAPDGRSFLMLQVEQLPVARPPALHVLSHWWTELCGRQ